jgi:hypothetical protein
MKTKRPMGSFGPRPGAALGLGLAIATLLVSSCSSFESGVTAQPPTDPGFHTTASGTWTVWVNNTNLLNSTGRFQERLSDPRLCSISGMDTNLSNLAVTDANGTPVEAWIESFCPTPVIWVSLPSIGPAESTALTLAATGASDLSPNGPTGEAPQLSTTYGALDDGASVFPLYDDFSGTTLSAAWELTGNATVTVSNGLLYEASVGANRTFLSRPSVGVPQGVAVDVGGYTPNSTVQHIDLILDNDTGSLSDWGNGYFGGAMDGFGIDRNGTNRTFGAIGASTSAGTVGAAYVGSLSDWGGIVNMTVENDSAPVPWSNMVYNGSFAEFPTLALYAWGGNPSSDCGAIHAFWFRERAVPNEIVYVSYGAAPQVVAASGWTNFYEPLSLESFTLPDFPSPHNFTLMGANMTDSPVFADDASGDLTAYYIASNGTALVSFNLVTGAFAFLHAWTLQYDHGDYQELRPYATANGSVPFIYNAGGNHVDQFIVEVYFLANHTFVARTFSALPVPTYGFGTGAYGSGGWFYVARAETNGSLDVSVGNLWTGSTGNSSDSAHFPDWNSNVYFPTAPQVVEEDNFPLNHTKAFLSFNVSSNGTIAFVEKWSAPLASITGSETNDMDEFFQVLANGTTFAWGVTNSGDNSANDSYNVFEWWLYANMTQDTWAALNSTGLSGTTDNAAFSFENPSGYALNGYNPYVPTDEYQAPLSDALNETNIYASNNEWLNEFVQSTTFGWRTSPTRTQWEMYNSWTYAAPNALSGNIQFGRETIFYAWGPLPVGAVHPTVDLTTDPTTCGSITFNGTTYTNGQSVQVAPGSYGVSAQGCPGFHLASLVGSGLVSVGGGTATVAGSGAIVATFTSSLPPTYPVSFTTDPSTCGSILFNGTPYTSGQSVNVSAATYAVSATACSGSTLESLSGSGSVSVAGPTATVDGPGGISATFSAIPPGTYLVDFTTDPATCGSITFNGTPYPGGQSVAVTEGAYAVSATACSGYTLRTLVGTGSVSVAGPTATVGGPGAIIATFAAIPPATYRVSFTTAPVSCGSITFNGTAFANGRSVEVGAGAFAVSATACAGYSLGNVTGTGSVSVKGSTATVSGAGGITANFSENSTPSYRTPGHPASQGEEVYYIVGGTGAGVVAAVALVWVARRRRSKPPSRTPSKPEPAGKPPAPGSS